jgi:2-polyprenyl-6-methoxyphenol hydroxylase-like FAD-dependent oxidoreductase
MDTWTRPTTHARARAESTANTNGRRDARHATAPSGAADNATPSPIPDLIPEHTGDDIEHTIDPLPSASDGRGRARKDGHALVIGGSIAGLLAARVLSDHFAQVTIVERDWFPDGPEFRAGVPQSRHVHALLGRGQALMERLFPGLIAELTDAGAAVLAWPADLLSLGPAGWSRRFPTSVTALTLSRHLLEWTIRRRVAALERVRFVTASEVIGLLAGPDRRAVCGVWLRRRVRAAPGVTAVPGDEELAADLVVDASGRGSHASRWLEALGYQAPRESRVDPFVGYATRLYRAPGSFAADWRAILLRGVAPRDPRIGLLIPIEGDRWLVTLGGYARAYPPTDDDGFLAYARSLRSRVLYDAIKNAEPLTPIYGYQRTGNLLRHYDGLARWPERFVVTGDAVCAFNPIYAQGMTVAALDAAELDACLREPWRGAPDGDLSGFARLFQQRLGKGVAGPWLIATSADFRFPTTEGGRPKPTARLVQKYIDRVIAVATEDPHVFEAFMEVNNMLAPPTRLFRPDILPRVLAGLREPPLIEPPARQAAGPETTLGDQLAAQAAPASTPV